MSGLRTVARFRTVEEVLPDADPRRLTPVERRRWERLHQSADRDAFLAAHTLVRWCAAELLGVAWTELRLRQDCPECGSGQHGAPAIAGSEGYVSLAHTRTHVAAIASHVACGIDVESVGSAPVSRALSVRERSWLQAQPDAAAAFAQLWVRKEALVKAGHGSLAGADRIDVLDESGPSAKVAGVTLAEWTDGRAVGAYALRSRPESPGT